MHTFLHRHYFKHYHGVYRHAKKLFALDLFLLAVAIAMLGGSIFFYFWKPTIAGLIDINVTLGDGRVRSGEPTRLHIDYANRSKHALQDATLAVHAPDGFVIDRVRTPESLLSKQSLVDLGTIPAGAKGQLDIDGTLWSEPGTDSRILILLDYTPEDTARREQKAGAYVVRLPESILTAALTVATSTLPGQKIPFTYALTNRGQSAAGSVVIALDTKLRHTITTDELKPFALPAGETKTITGELTAPTTGGTYPFTVRSSAVIRGKSITQLTHSAPLALIEPLVTSQAKLAQERSFATAGDVVPITVSWKNTTSFPLNNLSVRLEITPGIVDLIKTARENNIRSQGDSLLIESRHRTALAKKTSPNEDTFAIELHLLPRFKTAAGGSKPSDLTVRPVMEMNLPALDGAPYSKPGQALRLPLATTLELTASARYYTPEGDQLGRGPLPPRIGETTKYWIFITAASTVSPVRDPRLAIELAPGVTFTGKQSVTLGAPLARSPEAAKLTWSHSELPSAAATSWYFEVAATPAPTQLGKNVLLVKEITLTGTDTRLGTTLSTSQGTVDNTLSSDDRGRTRGSKVQ